MATEFIEKLGSVPEILKHLLKEFNWEHLKSRKVRLGILFGLSTAYILFNQITKKRYKLPPGPKPYPIIGNLLDIGTTDTRLKFTEYGKIYGPAMTVYLGSQRVIILGNMETIKEAFAQKGSDYAGRPVSYVFDLFSDNGKSIVLGQYKPIWKAQRSIAHAALRKYANTDGIEQLVESSFRQLSGLLDNAKEPIDPAEYTMLYIYNVFASMCFGKHYDINDPFFKEMRERYERMTHYGSQFMLLDAFPFLANNIFGFDVIKDMKGFSKFLLDSLGKEFEEHLATYDPDNLTDFTYDSIHLWKEAQSEYKDSSMYAQLTKNHFLFAISDVFSAGTSTTRTTLTFVILYLTYYPEFQKKVHEEIDRVLGKDKKPRLSSKENMHYLNAVLYEAMRIQPVAALGVPHMTRCDTTLGKYDIPKNTLVISNIWAVHHDPAEYKDPEIFNPDRWLDENGRFNQNAGPWIPYSLGKRNCVGEALSKALIPLTLTWFFQRYQFESIPGEKLTLETTQTMSSLEPVPFKVKVIPRYS